MGRGLAPERRPLEDLDADAVAALEVAPQRVGLREEHVRVEREDPGLRLALEQHVDEHALLLLEGARERERGVQALERSVDHLPGGQGFHVGLADELDDAPLHPANRISHDERLWATLAIVRLFDRTVRRARASGA